VEIEEKTRLFSVHEIACNRDLKIITPLLPSNSRAEHCPG
jgi:hypothetical protein